MPTLTVVSYPWRICWSEMGSILMAWFLTLMKFNFSFKEFGIQLNQTWKGRKVTIIASGRPKAKAETQFLRPKGRRDWITESIMTTEGQDYTDRETLHSGLLLFGTDLCESCYRLQLPQKMQNLLLVLTSRDIVITSGKEDLA